MPEIVKKARPAQSFAQRLRSLLAKEGYRPTLELGEDAPSVLRFKVEGNTFLMRCKEDDPDFVQVCTGFSLEGTTQDELTLLRAANALQNETKVAKVYVPPGRTYVEFQAELFLGGHPFSAEWLRRCIDNLKWTSRAYYQRITPELPQARA